MQVTKGHGHEAHEDRRRVGPPSRTPAFKWVLVTEEPELPLGSGNGNVQERTDGRVPLDLLSRETSSLTP